MEEPLSIPICPPAPNDTVPMLVVVGVFVLAGWLLRRWRRKRSSKARK